MGIVDKNFRHYLIYLWPLPVIFLLGQMVMRANGNATNLGITSAVSIMDAVVFITLFCGAAWWSFKPLKAVLMTPDHPEKHRRLIESVMADFPWRTLKGYTIAGWLFALYLIIVISSVALMGDHLFTWRMFLALTLNFCFGGGVLAPALAVSSSIVYSTRLRSKFSLQGLFVSELSSSKRVERYLISSQYRPWLIFLSTGFLPILILGLFVYLAQAGEVAEEYFILSQAMVLVSMSICGGMILVWFLSYTLKQVTRSLKTGLHHLAEGHFTGRVPVLIDDEFGELARGLNTAMHGLQEREDLKDSLAIAAEIQQGLLPKHAPVIPSYKLEGFQQTCYSVGGDYFDYVALENGHVWLVVADVSGKGYPAALTMANLQAMLRGLAMVDWPIEVAADYLNGALCDSLAAGRFVTLFMGKLQPEAHSLVWVNAGHVPPLLANSEGIRPLEASAPPLGLVKGISYEVGRAEFMQGDTLLIYTDGVTESSSRVGKEMFGEARLRKWLANHLADPLDQYPTLLLEELNKYGRNELDDDLTLLCVRRE